MINLKFVSPVLQWESPSLTSFKKTAVCVEIKDSNDQIIRVLSLTGFVIRHKILHKKEELYKTIYSVRVQERTEDGIMSIWDSERQFEDESEALVFCHRMIEDRMKLTIDYVSSILSSITEYDPRDLSIMPMIEQLIKDEGGKYYELEDDDLLY